MNSVIYCANCHCNGVYYSGIYYNKGLLTVFVESELQNTYVHVGQRSLMNLLLCDVIFFKIKINTLHAHRSDELYS